MTKRTYNQYCPLARSLDLIGERWTLLIIRNLFTGPKRFSDLLRGLPGIGTNILTTRLKSLEEEGLVQSRFLPPPAASSVYELTDYGQSLENVMIALALWGSQSMGAPQAEEVISLESVNLMVYMLFKTTALAGLSGTYAVKIDDANLSANFAVRLQGDRITVGSELPPSYQVALCADLATIGALATQNLSFRQALDAGMLKLEGSEPESARFLSQFASERG